jgi:zona occludens toxin (predicted ATPase)
VKRRGSDKNNFLTPSFRMGKRSITNIRGFSPEKKFE